MLVRLILAWAVWFASPAFAASDTLYAIVGGPRDDFPSLLKIVDGEVTRQRTLNTMVPHFYGVSGSSLAVVGETTGDLVVRVFDYAGGELEHRHELSILPHARMIQPFHAVAFSEDETKIYFPARGVEPQAVKLDIYLIEVDVRSGEERVVSPIASRATPLSYGEAVLSLGGEGLHIYRPQRGEGRAVPLGQTRHDYLSVFAWEGDGVYALTEDWKLQRILDDDLDAVGAEEAVSLGEVEGETSWSPPQPLVFEGRPALAVGARDGDAGRFRIHVFDRDTGEELWGKMFLFDSSSFSFSADGEGLYLFDSDEDRIVRYRVGKGESTVVYQSPWPLNILGGRVLRPPASTVGGEADHSLCNSN